MNPPEDSQLTRVLKGFMAESRGALKDVASNGKVHHLDFQIFCWYIRHRNHQLSTVIDNCSETQGKHLFLGMP